MAPPGAAVGTAGLWPVPGVRPHVPELSLYVRPEWRRRGIGSRLLTAIRDRATGPLLVADVPAGSPAEAFCQWHGFRHARCRRHDLLTYGDVHQAWLGELVDTEHPGYRLLHWTGDLPGTPHVAELIRSPSGPGTTVLTAADADGDLAAYAVAVVGMLTRRRARQYGPAVLPGHRGRRLGRWVNAALIQRLRAEHPHIDEVEAVAGADDPGLLAARADLGFRIRRKSHLYELTLP